MDDELNKLMFETQKQYKKSNKLKDKIIILLTVLMFAEAVIFYGGFVWYESQFDYVSTEQSTETQDVDVQQAEKMQTQNITTMMYREINIMAMPYIMRAVSNNGKSERTCNKVYNENTHNS